MRSNRSSSRQIRRRMARPMPSIHPKRNARVNQRSVLNLLRRKRREVIERRNRSTNRNKRVHRTTTGLSSPALLPALRRDATRMRQDRQLIAASRQARSDASNDHELGELQQTVVNQPRFEPDDEHSGVAHLAIHPNRPHREGRLVDQAQSPNKRAVQAVQPRLEVVRRATESLDLVRLCE